MKIGVPRNEKIRIEDLICEAGVGRQVEYGWRAEAMAWSWRDDRYSSIYVARRPDGAMVILDGKCRRKAAEIAGITALNCVVVDIETIQERAAEAYRLETEKIPWTPNSLLTNLVTAGDAAATEIRDKFARAGYRFSDGRNMIGSFTTVRCWRTIERMISREDRIENARNAVDSILGITMPGNLISGEVLRALFEFSVRSKDIRVDDRKVVSILKTARPKGILKSIEKHGKGSRCGAAVAEGVRALLVSSLPVVPASLKRKFYV